MPELQFLALDLPGAANDELVADATARGTAAAPNHLGLYADLFGDGSVAVVPISEHTGGPSGSSRGLRSARGQGIIVA